MKGMQTQITHLTQQAERNQEHNERMENMARTGGDQVATSANNNQNSTETNNNNQRKKPQGPAEVPGTPPKVVDVDLDYLGSTVARYENDEFNFDLRKPGATPANMSESESLVENCFPAAILGPNEFNWVGSDSSPSSFRTAPKIASHGR